VIAGTDTGVGKTVLAAMMTLAFDADYWKPVQAGTIEETDSEAVERMTGLSPDRIHPERYRLREPMSPDQAAAIEGMELDIERFDPPATSRPLIIECAGGLLVPLNRSALQIDLLSRWRAPVLLAARSTLGTLNHTLLSLEALCARPIPVAGIVLIGPDHPENIESLRRWSPVPIVGSIPPLDSLNGTTLLEVYRQRFIPFISWHPSLHDD
jgi:dethiobiotin synthetase